MSEENPIYDTIDNELNDKQKRFCEEYFLDYNGTRSYRKVYGIENEDVASASASRLLRNVKIKAYLEELKSDLASIAGISPIMVLNEHKKMAFSSIAHLHLTWIERKEFDTLTDEQTSCIEEISTKTRTEWEYDPENPKEKKPIEVEYVKIKLYDKQKSLDSINKMLGYDAPTKTESKVTLSEGTIIKWGDKEIKI